MTPATVAPTGSFINAIIGGLELSVALPDDITPEALVDNMRLCGSCLGDIEGASSVLKYSMGKMLALAQSMPDFLERSGFSTFDDFIEDLKARSKIKSRSTIYGWSPVYKSLPDLTREQLTEISQDKLFLIAKCPESKREGLLAIASSITTKELKSHLEDKGLLSAADLGNADLLITGPRELINELKEFLDNEAVRDYCATSHPIDILLAAIAETQSSVTGWPKI